MKIDYNRKILLTILIPLLGFSFIFVSPVMGVDPIYEVNPNHYEINVNFGDFRTYQFQNIRIQNGVDGIERHEVNTSFLFGGVNTPINVSEGSKITLEVVDINSTYIEIESILYHRNGSVYYPDNSLINRSTLDVGVNKDQGPRMILTTNETLISEVYGGTSWNLEIHEDMVRISNHTESDTTTGYYHNDEEYEYDRVTGFLKKFRMNSGGPDNWMEIEFSQVETWNPDHFELAVTVGDTNTYLLKKATFFDHMMEPEGGYRNEFHIQITENGQPMHLDFLPGDEIIAEVNSTDGDFVELQLTYHLMKDDTKHTDDYLYGIDKSTFWSPRIFGPPLLMTTNLTSLESSPQEILIEDDVVKFKNEYEDPEGRWYNKREGSWNLTTGWMLRFYEINIEYPDITDPTSEKIIQRELEIIDADYIIPVEEFVGVKEGDSIEYEFKEIYQPAPENTSIISLATIPEDNQLMMPIMIDGKQEGVIVQTGDKIKITVDKVEGSEVIIVLTIYSSLDGEFTSDPMVFDLADLRFEEGPPPFIIPTDEQMIRDTFEYDLGADVTFYDDETVKIIINEAYTNTGSSLPGNIEVVREMTYDLKTGWLLEYEQITMENDETIGRIYIKYTTMTNESGIKTSGDAQLTSFSFLPVIFALVLTTGLIQKKRRN